MAGRTKAIVLSDLHLGEGASVFTEAGGEAFSNEAGEAVRRMIERLLSSQEGRAEYLILAGDILDLSLASRAAAFVAFRSFLEQVAPLFESLIYVPGNHDHHVWVGLQEEARIFARIRQGEPVLPYYDALVPTIEPDGLTLGNLPDGEPRTEDDVPGSPIGKKTFLYSLLPGTARARGMDFVVAYPNVHLRLPRASIMVTHGHFFEDAWTIFTDALPESLGTTSLSYVELERYNSPFTEFAWYHLWQAGLLSDLIERIWRELRSGAEEPLPVLEAVRSEVTAFLDNRLEFSPSDGGGLSRFFARMIAAPASEWASDRIIELSLGVLEKVLVSQARLHGADPPGSSLRHAADIFADGRKAAKARWYLEMAGRMAEPFVPSALVFGHTHVPLSDGVLESADGCVTTWNAGAWLLDGSNPATLSASRPAIVAIDEEGDLETILVPWPSESEFQAAAPLLADGEHFRRAVHEAALAAMTRKE